jgi:hypothetical protein
MFSTAGVCVSAEMVGSSIRGGRSPTTCRPQGGPSLRARQKTQKGYIVRGVAFFALRSTVGSNSRFMPCKNRQSVIRLSGSAPAIGSCCSLFQLTRMEAKLSYWSHYVRHSSPMRLRTGAFGV